MDTIKTPLLFLLVTSLLALPLSTYGDDRYKIDYARYGQDRDIETHFLDGLPWKDKRFAQSRTNIYVYNGYALLYGEVVDDELIAIAENHLRSLAHVRRVFNQLTDDEVYEPDTLEEIIISASVKGYLVSTKGLDASRIRYVVDQTENETTVYLFGLVSDTDAQVAVQQARKAKGLTRVVTLFEYVQ